MPDNQYKSDPCTKQWKSKGSVLQHSWTICAALLFVSDSHDSLFFFFFVPSLGTHSLLFAYCFWLSVLSHRSENRRKAAKWHKTRRDRIARTAEIGTDGGAIGRWHFLVITKATAGCKHKKNSSPETRALLQLYFALQARPSEGAENN